ncbi:hypothetical protein MKX01_030738 [Papaver californicum]|nr:hypothetical protein MKX01_030738 [Papaver californicum]
MGRIWPVEIRKAEGEIYFRSGWQQFMEYFSISVGHVLIFRYEGDSHFHVSICDKTACEIDYPYSDKHNVTDNIQENRCKPQAINFKREPGVVAINSQSSDECPVPTQHRSASHKGKCKIPKKASCAARKLDVLERKSKSAMSVIKEARSFKSEFPTCTIIMKPSHLHKGNAHVPSEFARDFLTKAGDNLVTLKDSTGKKWHVGYYIRRVGTSSSLKVYLYKGWYGFVLDNHLKVDDACVFELVDIDNLEMKVNIIQASPDMV